jgi:hypothetical protein
MIYAIRAVGTEYIKFGRASSVGRRLREMETGCPHELHIEAVADWPDGAETAIHRLLEDQCQNREWFKDCEMAKLIIEWMGNKDAGLARLHHEVRKLGLTANWTGPASPTRADWKGPVPSALKARQLSKAQKRREERLAYWKARGINAESWH